MTPREATLTEERRTVARIIHADLGLVDGYTASRGATHSQTPRKPFRGSAAPRPHGGGLVTVRAFSYGGGVQSTAALVLAAQRRIDFPLFILANVGDDSENPATIDYVREHAAPFAATHGIELVEVRKRRRDGTPDDLLARILRTDRSLPFPVRMSNGAPGRRSCTAEFKIRVIERELRRRGATDAAPATVGLGITVDEIQRARTSHPADRWTTRTYPLIDIGLYRDDCMTIIRDAGLPVPPKSSCWFCPFHHMDAWRELRRTRPDLFARAQQLEATLNARRDALGKDHVWLTRYGRPIGEVVADQLVIDGTTELDNCESGYCLT